MLSSAALLPSTARTETLRALNLKPYCGSIANLDEIRKVQAEVTTKDNSGIPATAFYERRIQYILTTANNWSGPIRTFHLEVSTDSSEDIFSTCFPGVKRSSATSYELTRVDFHPDRELDLLILQANR